MFMVENRKIYSTFQGNKFFASYFPQNPQRNEKLLALRKEMGYGNLSSEIFFLIKRMLL